jgi:uncharacterized protein (UPF0276 family)
MSKTPLPQLGFGLGLRPKHYPYIFAHLPQVDWFEIISENFIDKAGAPRRNLADIRAHYPIVMHGVALSIGTVDPLNGGYLHKLKHLIEDVKPAWISDHLCWTGVAHKTTHDLLPLPYNENTLKHIVERTLKVQDFLGRPIALENPSTYLEFKHSSMPEAEFIARLVEDAGCYLLLDVNNVYVTCYNHRLDPKAYLDTLPLDRVIQIHLSGHSDKGHYLIDTHDDHVAEGVWSLYKYVIHKAGRVPNTMLEWDQHIPEFPVLLAELDKAKDAAKGAKNYELTPLFAAELPDPPCHDKPLQEAQLLMQNAIMQQDHYDSAPATWIRAKPYWAPEDQLAVYVQAYRSRLQRAVAEDYIVLQGYLGQGEFYRLIQEFVQEARPTDFHIGRFALTLPSFLTDKIPQDVFAQELCQLETAIAALAFLKDSAPLEPHHLEGLKVENFMESRLYPRQALKLMHFAYPVNAYYRKVMAGISAKKPRRKTSYLALFRHEDVVWRLELHAKEYALLRALFAGKTIGAVLESIEPSATCDISQYFARWMRNGLLAAHDYKNHPPKGSPHDNDTA